MTIKEYLTGERHYLYQCKMGDQLVKNIVFRGLWESDYKTDEEVLHRCGNIPNTIPLELYMTDPQKAELVASDAYIECIRTLKLKPVIEEYLYERRRRYDGYTNLKQIPLYKCLTQGDKQNHAPSIEGELARYCVTMELSAAPESIGCHLKIDSMRDIMDGFATEFVLRDGRGWTSKYAQNWGMTIDSMKKFRYEKILPYKDVKTGRKYTAEETEAYLRARAAREKQYYEETHPPRSDEFCLPIPCPYYYDKNDKAIPIDSVDEWGHPIYIFEKGQKTWIQPEKREYSEHKRKEFEIELEKYNKIHDQMIADGALEFLHYNNVRMCLDRLREAIENRESDDAIRTLTEEFIKEIEAQNETVSLGRKAFEPNYYEDLVNRIDDEYDALYPEYNKRAFQKKEVTKEEVEEDPDIEQDDEEDFEQ